MPWPACTRCGRTTTTRSSRDLGHQRFIFWAYADDADHDPRVARAVEELGIRYVITSSPGGAGFPDARRSSVLGKSASWAKIYDNGETRIYEWRGGAIWNREHGRRQHRDDDIGASDGRRRHPPDDDDTSITDPVQQPAKVMRIGTMIKQFLEEVKAAPLDDASRNPAARHPQDVDPRTGGRPGPGAARRTGTTGAAVQRRFGAVGRRTADRAGPAGGLARRPLFTASRPRCSPSRWPPAPNSSRCARRAASRMAPSANGPAGSGRRHRQYL